MAGFLCCKCSYISYILPSNNIKALGVATVAVGGATTLFLRDRLLPQQTSGVEKK